MATLDEFPGRVASEFVGFSPEVIMRVSYSGCVMGATLLIVGCGDTSTQPSAKRSVPVVASEPLSTPLQNRVARSIAARAARGLRTPTVSYRFESAQGSSLRELESKRYGPGGGYAYRAVTVIEYAGPEEAGLDNWPALALSPDQSRKLRVSSAQLQARYVERRSAMRPDLWQRYKVGHEPRTYTITESGKAIYRPVRTARNVSALVAAASGDATQTSQDDLVFGFTANVPDIERSWSFGFEGVEEITFSLDFLNWGIGLRLPLRGEVETPVSMPEGTTHSATSRLHGLNYSGADYSAVGLASESGDEAYFRFELQGCVELSGVLDFGKECVGPDLRRSRDFTTPFGPGSDVSLPTFDISVIDYGLAGIDLDLDSNVGSDRITSRWSVLGAATGSGHLTYSSAGSPVTLSSINAIDGPGQALLAIDGFLYHFTRFTVSPSVRLWVDVEVPIPLAPDLEWDDSWSFPLGTYDLSDFIDIDFIDSNGASVGLHHNSEYTGATKLTMSVPVTNVAPTANVSVGGGQTFDINGIPTIVGVTGESFVFTGTAHDPGRDDLTLSWDWGDGPPSPDHSTLVPLSNPAGPNNATDVRNHAFTKGCLYDVLFRAVDDDDASTETRVSILVTETGNASRMEGYWQSQLREGGNSLSPEQLNCYLAVVQHVSKVFSERRGASSRAEALSVLHLAGNSGSESEQLDRELLVVLLNFASGAIGYSRLVDTNSDGIPDTPLLQVVQVAEATRLDPSSTTAALKEQTRLLHRVSEQFTAGFR